MRRPILAAVAVAIVALTVAALWAIGTTPREAAPFGFRLEEFVIYLPLQLAFGSVGLLLAARRPRNPIGWLLLATAAVAAWVEAASGYAVKAMAEGRPEGVTAAWIYNWGPTLFTTLVIVPLILFPNGRPATRAGALALWLTPLGTLGVAVFVAFRTGPLLNMPSVENPFGLTLADPRYAVPSLIGISALGIAIVAFIRDLASRFRAASGVLRQQLKWVLWSGVLLTVHLLASGLVLLTAVEGASGGPLTYAVRGTFVLVICTLPVAIAIAILRHRLYDIDHLIKRTLVYGALSGVLVATYAGSVILAGGLLRAFTGGSEIAVAGSTLVVVALVQPLRRRIQEVVDRRFYRSRYDATRTLDGFTARLRSEVDLDAVSADVLDVIADTIRPAHASVWLRRTG